MLQQATHIPSGTRGTIIGLNNQRKAHIIKLPNGLQQYWKVESTLKGEQDMTDHYEFTLTNNRHDTLKRFFDTQEEASQYLSELACFNTLYDFDNDNLKASMSKGWSIECNHDMKKIMKVKPKKSNLIRLSRTKVNHATPDKLEQPNKKIKKTPTGDMVKLQDLTNDTRKARVILRALVRKKEIVKPGRWEWKSDCEDLAIVKAALKK